MRSQWKENGHADGLTVSADGLGSYHAGASERSHDFPLKEWQFCSSGSVTQHFNGAASTSKSGRADPAYVRKVKAAVKAPMLTWDANDPNIIKVSGGSVNMYGQPGRTVITFTADGKSYDVAWVLGSDKLNVKDVLPTGVDYAWKAKVVGTDTALNNEDNGGTLLDHDRYKAPTPKPEPSEPSEPSKPSEPSVLTRPRKAKRPRGMTGLWHPPSPCPPSTAHPSLGSAAWPTTPDGETDDHSNRKHNEPSTRATQQARSNP